MSRIWKVTIKQVNCSTTYNTNACVILWWAETGKSKMKNDPFVAIFRRGERLLVGHSTV